MFNNTVGINAHYSGKITTRFIPETYLDDYLTTEPKNDTVAYAHQLTEGQPVRANIYYWYYATAEDRADRADHFGFTLPEESKVRVRFTFKEKHHWRLKPQLIWYYKNTTPADNQFGFLYKDFKFVDEYSIDTVLYLSRGYYVLKIDPGVDSWGSLISNAYEVRYDVLETYPDTPEPNGSFAYSGPTPGGTRLQEGVETHATICFNPEGETNMKDDRDQYMFTLDKTSDVKITVKNIQILDYHTRIRVSSSLFQTPDTTVYPTYFRSRSTVRPLFSCV